MANNDNSLLEKRLAASIFRFSLEPRINQIAILIDSPIQVAPFPMDLPVRFITIAGCPCLPMSLAS
jgi:hypothetical protein